jgi:hypothetical protein
MEKKIFAVVLITMMILFSSGLFAAEREVKPLHPEAIDDPDKTSPEFRAEVIEELKKLRPAFKIEVEYSIERVKAEGVASEYVNGVSLFSE